MHKVVGFQKNKRNQEPEFVNIEMLQYMLLSFKRFISNSNITGKIELFWGLGNGNNLLNL